MQKADSLLDAAKKISEALGVSWPEAQKVYKELQSAGADSWLPKSQGRNIWLAHPNYAARLIAGLCFRGSNYSPVEGIFLTHSMTPAGRAMRGNEYYALHEAPVPFEAHMVAVLTESDAASDLIGIEFVPDRKEVAFHHSTGSTVFLPTSRFQWAKASVLYEHGVEKAVSKPAKPGLAVRWFVSGEAIRDIQRAVNWFNGAFPMEHGSSRHADPE